MRPRTTPPTERSRATTPPLPRLHLYLAAAVLAGAALLAWSPRPPESQGAVNAARATNPVLLELFTSQGCSSCPPADRLLAEITERPEYADKVVAIAWHVDYWNHLGWQDPFSSAKHSQRQRDYAMALPAGRVYTPQAVVDGRNHWVGSDRRRIEAAIEKALKRERTVDLELSARRAGDGMVEISARAKIAGPGGSPGRYRAFAVLTESGLQTDVARGENGGRHLPNAHVARHLEPLFTVSEGAPEGHGRASVHLQAGWRPARMRVVVYVQDLDSLEIEAATSVALAALDG